MAEYTEVTGIVIKSQPVGESDRTLTLFTKEKGKITAYARGARRQGNRLTAPTGAFSFGKFKLFPGRSSYNLTDADIITYFEEFRTDYEACCFGTYFLELVDYYGRENNVDVDMLKLIYQSLKALCHDAYDNRLVRAIFEIKLMCIEGEFPGILSEEVKSDTRYTVDYIASSKIEKLYSFSVTDEILGELISVANKCVAATFDKKFQSMEILNVLINY